MAQNDDKNIQEEELIKDQIQKDNQQEVEKKTTKKQKPKVEIENEEEITEEIIVASSDDEKKEVVVEDEDYGLVEEDDSTLKSTVTIDNEEDEVDENPSNKKRNKGYFKRQTNKDLRNFKTNSSAFDNLDLTNLHAKDLNIDDEDYVDKKTKALNMLKMSRVTTIPLLASGYACGISAYSFADLIGINRYISGNDSYVVRQETIIKSIYDHTKTFSPGKMSIEQWLKNTMLPDLEMLFFGSYDATSPGENTYMLRCYQCGDSNEFTFSNDEIMFTPNKEHVGQNDINYLIKSDKKSIEENIKHVKIAEYVKKTRLTKMLKESKIVVEWKIPNLFEYLETLHVIQSLENYDIEDLDKPNTPSFQMLNMLLYISSVKIPISVETENGTNKYRYHNIEDKAEVIEIIDNLSAKDSSELFKGEDIKKMISVKPITFKLIDVTCPSCKKVMKDIPLKLAHIFFIYINQTTYGTINQ